MISNHGDRKFPKGCSPSESLNGLQIGVTNYLITGMILQVGDAENSRCNHEKTCVENQIGPSQNSAFHVVQGVKKNPES